MKHSITLSKFDSGNGFRSFFNPATGFYMRTGILDESGNDTNVDPFMSSYPELLDIGIMGTCTNNGMCFESSIQCYQNGLNVKKPDMSFEDFKSIIDQSKGNVYQVALGGRGDPNKHKDFDKIISYCNSSNIVPNYTTSGFNLTDEEIEISKKCGAVAVSAYSRIINNKESNMNTVNALNRFVKSGIKTNIHFVLSNATIDEAIYRLKNNLFQEGINAVVFLLHKPIGLGQQDNVLESGDERIVEFFSIIENQKLPFKVGFDSCSAPALINYTKTIDKSTFDTCESGRFSGYISADMKMFPCSFSDASSGIDLSKHSIQEAWDSDVFNDFRTHFNKHCLSCSEHETCKSGCPIASKIVLCERKEKDIV